MIPLAKQHSHLKTNQSKADQPWQSSMECDNENKEVCSVRAATLTMTLRESMNNGNACSGELTTLNKFSSD